jgi:hypothetical protein
MKKSFLGVLFFGMGCMDYSVSRKFYTDSFVQPARESGVDILWMIDDSASMFEEQDQLAAHADSFIRYLSAAPVDFLMGVATTDISIEVPGSLVGPLLSVDTADLAGAFAEQVFLEEGSRVEEGFAATLFALDLDGPNGDQLRANADLELIFFTDEDDQSVLSPQDFQVALRALRPSTNIVVNAIVGDPPEGCASAYGAADAGLKYQQIQSSTEGLRESICSLDYDAMLSRIALKVLGMENTFGLSNAPDLSTMEVRVDNALVHRRDRHGWSYDAGKNAIVFDGYAVPYPGAEVVFSYARWVGPQEGFENQLEDSGGVE